MNTVARFATQGETLRSRCVRETSNPHALDFIEGDLVAAAIVEAGGTARFVVGHLPPIGTVLWSAPDDGSGVTSIVPAVPSTTGVADVFSFEGDGTVAAITSNGTAWTADLSSSLTALPDFLGGLMSANFVPGNCCSLASITRLDGITGQVDATFTPSGQVTCGEMKRTP